MVLIPWHAVILAVSACAAIIGLLLGLPDYDLKSFPTTTDLTQDSLVRMVFLYWLLFCISEGGESLISADFLTLSAVLRLIAMVSYVLTFCCLVSLPLHHLEIHQHHDPSRS